jgi:hypothetical protein
LWPDEKGAHKVDSQDHDGDANEIGIQFLGIVDPEPIGELDLVDKEPARDSTAVTMMMWVSRQMRPRPPKAKKWMRPGPGSGQESGIVK